MCARRYFGGDHHMPWTIGPIDPTEAARAATSPKMPTNQALQRTVQAGVQALGGAANYGAQQTVQSQKSAETRAAQSHLIDKRITTATLAALAPVGSAHDEDEADAEREEHAFGRWSHPKKKVSRRPPQR
jgi:hypothetical protein